MNESKGEVWLQTEQLDGSYLCEAFSGVPAIRRSLIALVSSGSTNGRKYASDLRAEIEAVLLSSNPEVVKLTIQCKQDPPAMDPVQFGDRRKVLVLIGSEDEAFVDHAWFNRWDSDENDAAVMTVLPPGDFQSFFANSIARDASHLLCRVNASRWSKKVVECVPGILARSQVTVGSSRVFISYRRLETLVLALQVFDQLTHEGFDVFLDRFSIPPGYDFQRRLNQELEDKSMVVLLESRYTKNSKWTQHEIDFAKRNRLGILAVQMPDVKTGDELASISSEARLAPPLTKDDFVGMPITVPNPEKSGGSMNQWVKLKAGALERTVAGIKRAHATAIFQRRHRLRADLALELTKQGGIVSTNAAGPLLVRSGADEHLLWLTTRPPEVEDFRTTYAAHFARTAISAQSRAVVVGPQAALEPDRRVRLDWLQKVSQCVSFDEGKLADVARRVAKGEWT